MSERQSSAARCRVTRVGGVAGQLVWTPSQLRTLETMWRRGAPIKNIALEVGRSQRAVIKMRVKLGLGGRKSAGVVRSGALKVMMTDGELDGVQRRAHYHGMTVSAYLRRLLAADGAIGAS